MNRPEEVAGRPRPPSIPGYRIEGVLGKGATGVVYRAVQLSIGRVVALKVLHSESVRNPRVVRRLQREARTAARLKHPNIISAIDMGRADDTWWFAMELVEGTSLAERLEHGGRLSERKALAIFIPLCDALQHASERGVVHRDVKPANILLEQGDRPRLVDLGLARVEDDPLLTRTGATLGTPHYISPEQARDPATVDVRGDIWSLGATLFHAVCGRPPFTGESTAELFSNVLYGRIPDPRALRPDLSKGLALVLRKCLSRDPDKRYFTPGELREDLERVRDHKAPQIRTSALEPLGTRLSRERRYWTIAGIALLGLFALALATWRPWESTHAVREDAAADEASWPRFDQLVAEVRAGEVGLAAAWREREELCKHAPPSYVTRCRELRDELYAALDQATYDEQKRSREALDRMLREHDFPGAAELLERGAPDRLYATTGFRPDELPGRLGGGFQLVGHQLRELLDRTRAAAIDALGATMQGYFDNVLGPRLLALEQEKDYGRALALAGRERAELLADAGADARGLDAPEVEKRLRPFEKELQSQSYRLQQVRRQLDDELASWVDAQANAHEERLRRRAELSASDEFVSEFEAELTRRGLARERLEAGESKDSGEWRALARFELRRGALVELERELLAADAEARYEVLEKRSMELCAARDYEGAEDLWSGARDEVLLAPVLRQVELRIDEARQLGEFLRTAAAGVRSLDGQRFSFNWRSAGYTGRIESGHDPLQDGFVLLPEKSERASFRLRKPPHSSGDRALVLDAKGVERFAMEGAGDAQSADFTLQRALFRYHEANLEGARELLKLPVLSPDDYLVYDLTLRTTQGLDRQESLRQEAQAYARGLYERITQRKVEGDRGKVVHDIDELLQRHAEFFSPVETGRLREIKRELVGGPPPSTVEDFQRQFGPDEVEFTDPDGVMLRYRFDEPKIGAWDPGEWHCDGLGWRRSGFVANDDELVRAATPRLLLVDPFVIGNSPLEVRVTFEQLKDSQPNLLVVSAFGVHAAFEAGGARCGPHCLVDTDEIENVVARARACEGTSFAGFAPGERHTVRLRLTPDSGRCFVAADGESFGDQLRARAGNKGAQSVSIRSVEPVRLLEVEVRGTRR